MSGTLATDGKGEDDNAKRIDERNKGSIFKSCAPLTDSKSEINSIQIGNAKNKDFVMPMFNLIE